MIWQLRVWVKWDTNSINSTISQIKAEFKKAWSDIEKSLNSWAEKWLKEIWNESKKTINNIAWLNDKLDILRNKLKFADIWSKEFKKIQNEINKTEERLSKATWTASSFWSMLKWAFSIYAITAFTKSVFTLTSQNQQLHNSFVTLTWSEEEAKNMLSQIQSLADQSPFEKLDLANQTKKLMWYGFEWRNAINIMQVLWNTVSALWGWKDVLDWIVLALWQIQAKWRLSQEELNQFAERWVPAQDILREKLKLTEEQLQNIWSEWIKASEAIPALLQWLQEKYLWALEKQSQTLTGRLSTITDSAKNKLAGFWDDVLDTQSKVLDWTANMVNNDLPIILTWVSNAVNSIMDLWTTAVEQIESWFTTLDSKVADSWVKQISIFDRIAIWISLLWNWFSLLTNVVKNLWLVQIAIYKDLWANLKVFWSNAYSLFFNLWTNAWRALWNIPYYAKSWLNAFLQMLQNTVNEWVAILNKIPWVNIWSVKIWTIDAWTKQSYVDFTSWFKELPWFVNTSRASIVALSDVLTTNENNFKKLAEDIDNIWKKTEKAFKLDTLDWLWKAINEKRKDLKNLTIWSDEYIAKQKELTDLEEKFQKAIYSWNDKVWDSADKAWKKSSESSKEAKEKLGELTDKVKDLKEEYNDYEKLIKDLDNAQEKYNKNNIGYQEEIEAWIRKVNNSLKEQEVQYKKNTDLIETERNKKIWETNLSTEEKVAERLLEIENEKKDIQEELRVMQLKDRNANLANASQYSKDLLLSVSSQNFGAWTTADQLLKVIELSEKLEKLDQEQLEAKKQVNEEILKEKRVYDESTEFWKILIDQQKEIAKINEEQDKAKKETTDKYEEEKKKMEDFKTVYEAFNTDKKVTQEQLDQALTDERFLRLSQEEQELITKLAKEKISLWEQKDFIVSIEQEISDKKIELSNSTTEILKADISTLSSEYKKLISEIQTAINKQKELNALKGTSWATKGFADGWYTWDGWKYEYAWEVHKWEYVVPQSVISRMPDIVPKLETLRQWWNISNDYSRKIDVWAITVQERVDLELFFDKLKFKL